MGADLRDVRHEHDRTAAHQFRRGDRAAVLPHAAPQDRVEDLRLADQSTLHLERPEPILDPEHPAAAIHVAADGDEVAHESLSEEVDAWEIVDERGVGERHLDGRGGGGLGK